MKPLSEPERVKLVVSAFAADASVIDAALERLQEGFGRIDLLSGAAGFESTAYYAGEFGGGLKRKLASFEGLIRPDGLGRIKISTNSIEDEFKTTDGKRRVNIDPGLITLERLVLLSCKNFTHRIHLGEGVFADLTLIYTKGAWKALEWTYPDYQTEGLLSVLTRIRKRYAFQIGRGL